MRISSLKIRNFRNLDDIEIKFHPQINFIIGENNLGKSNILELLDIIFNKNSFDEQDFLDDKKPINVELVLNMENHEIGLFDDLISISEDNHNNTLNLLITQNYGDDSFEIKHKETDVKINRYALKKANLIIYNPVRNPNMELSFSRKVGVGKVLRYFAEESINSYQKIVDYSELEKVLDEIKAKIEYLLSFLENNTKLNYKQDFKEQVLSLIELADQNNISINNSGYGIQFSLLIILSIIQKLIEIKKKEKEYIFDDNEGNKYISLILGIDEPEIHLHPYMQRYLVKSINNIMLNKDSKFREFMKDSFGIDYIRGQTIIVTHSPNILLNDYNTYIRIYRENSKINVINGCSIGIDRDKEKHLRRQMQYIKEAFFSRCVIIVEGDTEYGAFPVFFERSGIDLDRHGISIIRADGKTNIKPLKKILNSFKIKNFSFADRDNGNDISSFDAVTKEQDFEADIGATLFDINDDKKKSIVDDILSETNQTQSPEINKEDFIKILRNNKSIKTGSIIAHSITESSTEYIPESISGFINKVKREMGIKDD